MLAGLFVFGRSFAVAQRVAANGADLLVALEDGLRRATAYGMRPRAVGTRLRHGYPSGARMLPLNSSSEPVAACSALAGLVVPPRS